MSGEPDSGTCAGGSVLKLEPPSIMRLCRSLNNNIDDLDCDNDKVTASNTNYDSNDATILRCERCDSFETISRALLIVHIAQCSGGAGPGGPVAIKRRHSDAATATDENGAESDAQTTSSTAAPSSGQTDSAHQTADKHHRKLFECDVCNMKFSNGANMRRHKMRHTGVKPYECRVCQKRFFRKDHLAEHFTTHTKTLPYHCPICNRGFQRQIAMRAHFQNEHVGQHELVKTCPLCSYRAGTMKSLRVHFFNRHGIDLDNPGANAPSSLLMALDPQNAGNFLQSSIAAAMAAAAAAGGGGGSSNGSATGQMQQQQSFSDSGDSLRSADNGTPPMHFLTPHVEISMADDSFNKVNHESDCNSRDRSYMMSSVTSGGAKIEPICGQMNVSSALEIKVCEPGSLMGGRRSRNGAGDGLLGASGAVSPQSADSNSSAPTSSQQTVLGAVLQSPARQMLQEQIKPSISLIPIKQEPSSDDYYHHDPSKPILPYDSSSAPLALTTTSNTADHSTPTSSLTSLIKVSPLKSLLREDLKRRISARANNRSTRNDNNNNTNNSTNHHNSHHHHNLASNTSITVTATDLSTSSTAAVVASSPSAPAASSVDASSSPLVITTAATSNGTITSTGADTELHLSGAARRRMLQCLFCGIEFPDQTLYFLHKGCHSESNPWKCNICGEQLGNVYEFNSHLLSKSHQ